MRPQRPVSASRWSRFLPAAFGRAAVMAVLIGLLVPLAQAGTQAAAATSKASGAVTVLENSAVAGSWPGLDPATDTQALANQDYLNAIFGGLFQETAAGTVPDLALGYKLAPDLLTATIYLRHGVAFQDGTAFDAAAVAENIERDLAPQYACICRSSFPVASVTTPDSYTVVLHLSKPFAPIINAFPGAAPNWIASPAALNKLGERAFALTPVGAGPFQVVSDVPSSKLVLKANPRYWQKGHPKLANLTFVTVGSDESAYGALQSGQAEVYGNFSTYNLIPQIRKQRAVRLTALPGSTPYVVQLNTSKPPFNNVLAREAVYYAIDPEAINRALFARLATPTESLTGPGDLFYEPKVPGYRTYDPSKAKALVKKLGGLAITLSAEQDQQQIAVAPQSELNRADIKTTLVTTILASELQNYRSNNWESVLTLSGAYDPALGLGLSFRYASNAPFTGVHDPALDALIDQGASTASPKTRAAIYHRAFRYLSDHAYSPVLFSTSGYTLTARSVHGPGLSVPARQVLWQDVSRS